MPGDDRYDAKEMGKVIATLEAQNKVLAEMHDDIEKLFSMIHAMQMAETERCRQAKVVDTGHDWGREIVIALLGALAYFILDHFITGGK